MERHGRGLGMCKLGLQELLFTTNLLQLLSTNREAEECSMLNNWNTSPEGGRCEQIQ